MYNTLGELATAICDSIRAKDGTSAPIAHQDMPSRIMLIQTTTNTVMQIPIQVYEDSQVEYVTEE